MPVSSSTCPLDCPDACGVLVESEVDGRFARLKGNPNHPYSRGTLCAKTSLYGELIQHPDRLRTPLVRDDRGTLRPASWEQAIARIVERVRGLPGESILAAWYAGTMGLVNRKFPLRMMHALGAVLVDGGLCDNTGTVGYQAVLGPLVGPDIEEASDADLVWLWGCDMVRTVQHLQPAVQRLCKRGVPVVAIDVYRTETIRALERWGGAGVIVRPGTDAALALCLARLAFERGYADRRFLDEECVGAGEFEAHVRSASDVESTSRITGVPREQLLWLCELLGNARRPFLKTGVGFSRRRNGGMSMRAVCSMAAVFGRADRVHFESAECFQLEESAIERPDLRAPGRAAERIRHIELGGELESGRFRCVFVWGHNPAVMVPDSARVRRGLARGDVFAVVHEQFLTETAQLADVVLPATMFVEHADVYRSYGHRYVQYSRRASLPPEGPRSNVRAFGALARALDLPAAAWDQSEEDLCEELLRASVGRLGERGLSELRAGRPFKVSLPAESPAAGTAAVPALESGVESAPGNRRWGTPTGQVELFSEQCRALGQPPMATYVPDDAFGDPRSYALISAPSRFTHNSTFSHSARHLARNGPPRCFIHPADAALLGLKDGQAAKLVNSIGSITLPVAFSDDMPRGAVRVDGVPRAADIPEGIGVNALVSSMASDLGEGNSLYSTRVNVCALAK